MGNSWQTAEHKAFFDEHLPSFTESSDAGKLKEQFWPMITDEWFKRWPLSKPPPEFIEKAGSIKKAQKDWKTKKIEVSVGQRHLASTWAYPSTEDKACLQGQG